MAGTQNERTSPCLAVMGTAVVKDCLIYSQEEEKNPRKEED